MTSERRVQDIMKVVGPLILGLLGIIAGPLPTRGEAVAAEARTVSSGRWAEPSTWENGIKPSSGQDATILHNVVLDTPEAAREVNVNAGRLTISGGTLETYDGS